MEEKRNVNISFKTTPKNKVDWSNHAKTNEISLSEFVHCAVELYYDESIGKTKELEGELNSLSKKLSKTKNELSNFKLQQQVKEERLETVISGLKTENHVISDKYEKSLQKIKKLEREKQKIIENINRYADKFSVLQIGLFSTINSDEIRALKG